jgi:hypothetical protein
MWSGGPVPECWPVTTASGTPDNSRLRPACRRRRRAYEPPSPAIASAGRRESLTRALRDPRNPGAWSATQSERARPTASPANGSAAVHGPPADHARPRRGDARPGRPAPRRPAGDRTPAPRSHSPPRRRASRRSLCRRAEAAGRTPDSRRPTAPKARRPGVSSSRMNSFRIRTWLQVPPAATVSATAGPPISGASAAGSCSREPSNIAVKLNSPTRCLARSPLTRTKSAFGPAFSTNNASSSTWASRCSGAIAFNETGLWPLPAARPTHCRSP